MCHARECYLVEAGYWIDHNKNIFTRNKILPYKLINHVIDKCNNKGVFITAYRYNTDNLNDAYLFGDLYFDFDDSKNYENVKLDALRAISYFKIVFKINPNDIDIFFSGNKGIHLIINHNILDIKPDKNLNKIFRHIAENIKKYTANKTIDLKVYDNKRLIRIPNTIHEKTQLYKIPLTYDELKTLSYENIKKLAIKPRNIDNKNYTHNTTASKMFQYFVETFYKDLQTSNNKNIKYNKTLNYIPPCIKNIIENGAIEGQRNNTIAALASFYRNYGLDLETAINKISEWNDEKNTPPTKYSELEKTVKSIYSGKANYGCNTLKILTQCDQQNCKLYK